MTKHAYEGTRGPRNKNKAWEERNKKSHRNPTKKGEVIWIVKKLESFLLYFFGVLESCSNSFFALVPFRATQIF